MRDNTVYEFDRIIEMLQDKIDNVREKHELEIERLKDQLEEEKYRYQKLHEQYNELMSQVVLPSGTPRMTLD